MKSQKTDYKFIVILGVLFAALTAAGLFFAAPKDDGVPIAELPQEDTAVYSGVIISEILSNNDGCYVNEEGEACDFIEIFNGKDHEINLKGYGLSDEENRVKWVFPDYSLQAGEYAVVNLSGKGKDGLNAGFKLSSKGNETVALFSPSNKVIDAVKTTALEKNQSMIRNGREWQTVEDATPGFANTTAGLEQYRSSLCAFSEDGLVVNEILPNNKGAFRNEDGKYAGYIELLNNSSSEILLSEYCISNSMQVPFKRRLPDVRLKPGQVYMLYTGDAYADANAYTGFRFANRTGQVILSRKGQIILQLDYEVANGCAYMRDENGSYCQSAAFTPGYANDSSGVEAFQKQYMKRGQSLLISEVMNSNSSVLPQNGGQYYDWVELYNNADEAVNLADYCLSNDNDNLFLYRLPDVVLQPGDYYVVMCSGDEGLSNQSFVHTGFKIGEAESIYLSREGRIEDSVFVYDVPTGYTYSRGDEYGWNYTQRPTPSEKNDNGSPAICAAPVFSIPGGLYEGNADLKLSIQGQGTIYYTTDGSTPTRASLQYTEPISLTSTRVIKACSICDGFLPSDYTCGSYIVDDSHSVPVVSVVMEPNEFDKLCERAWDRSLSYGAHVEIFEDGSSCGAICGIKLQGNTGRLYNKKNFAIKFDKQYGAGNLHYALFDEVNSSDYDSFVLRGGSNGEMYVFWKDEFATELAREYLEIRNYKPAVVYVNGEYKGYYNIREKINAEMIANHYNVDAERVSISRWNGDLEAGEDLWNPLLEWVSTHDLSQKENYEVLCAQMDMVQFCDLWIYQAFFDNPDVYNIRVFSHPDIDGGKIKFIFFDLDLGLFDERGNYFAEMIFNPSGYMEDLAEHRYSVALNLSLLQSEEFKALFLERLTYHLNNNLKKDRVLALFDEFHKLYEPELERDREAAQYTMENYNRLLGYSRRQLAKRGDLLKQYATSFFGVSVQ